MKVLLSLIYLIMFSAVAMAQNETPVIEMADQFRADGKIYVVVVVLSAVFLVLAAYMIYIDRNLKKTEKQVQDELSTN